MISKAFFNTEEAKDIIASVVKVFEKNNVDYGDVRFSRADSLTIGKDKEEEFVNSGKNFGFHLRVYKGSEWRSSAITTIEKNKILENAERLSRFTPKDNVPMSKEKSWEHDTEVESKNIGLEEKIKWVRDCFKKFKSSPKIANVSCVFGSSIVEKIFANTEGSMLREKSLPKARST